MRNGKSRDETRARVERALGEAAAARPLLGADTPDLVQGAVDRIAELLLTLPAEDREALLAEAVRKLASPESSLRKLEKRVRQAALATVSEARVFAVRELAPELAIEDLHGTVRFSLREARELEVAGTRYSATVVARLVGGALERSLLTRPPAEFVAQARTALQAQLAEARAESDAAAAAIDEHVKARLARPLYDGRTLQRIVARALKETEELPAALERIEYESRRLDRDAAERERVRELIERNGLIAYRDYFPRARELERELLLYVGPTNSGKTWHALNELVKYESGVYLAPLRLLALEGQEEIEKRGQVASYITGEERDIREGARFIASTIEMLDPQREVGAAVIDEIQLLTDRERGWAWCQALVGVPARRVLMTGSADCVPLVKALAAYLGEPLTIHHLERHTPLEAHREKLSLEHIEPGTALIAFSRREVLALKAQLEHRYSVAVIYGNLTPEVRREEARRFRDGRAQVLVSTDAIAMGLNLPIRTVCFTTLEKWNGEEDVQLEPWQILQIGGRAGRFGLHERGYVGALRRGDAERVRRVFSPHFQAPRRPLTTTVRPGREHVAVLAEALHTQSLAKVLGAFQRGMSFDSGLLAPGVQDDMVALAAIADRFPALPLEERLLLASAPVDMRQEWLVDEYGEWIAARARGQVVRLGPLAEEYRAARAADDQALQAAESEARRLTLYSWLSFRFADTFPDLAESAAQREAIDRFIERSLAQRLQGRGAQCRECGRPLARASRDGRCARCRPRPRRSARR